MKSHADLQRDMEWRGQYYLATDPSILQRQMYQIVGNVGNHHRVFSIDLVDIGASVFVAQQPESHTPPEQVQAMLDIIPQYADFPNLSVANNNFPDVVQALRDVWGRAKESRKQELEAQRSMLQLERSNALGTRPVQVRPDYIPQNIQSEAEWAIRGDVLADGMFMIPQHLVGPMSYIELDLHMDHALRESNLVFECPYRDTGYRQPTKMRSHMRSAHGVDRTFTITGINIEKQQYTAADSTGYNVRWRLIPCRTKT